MQLKTRFARSRPIVAMSIADSDEFGRRFRPKRACDSDEAGRGVNTIETFFSALTCPAILPLVGGPKRHGGCKRRADTVSRLPMSAASQSAEHRSSTRDLPAQQATGNRKALSDVRETAVLWRLCWTLAWLDIKLRYRGSILGPFWLTMSTAVMAGSMGVIYAALFKMELRVYLPFLVLSLVLWGFFGSLVSDGSVAFSASEGMIRSVRMPFTLYAARIVLRNVLILAHNLVAVVAVLAIFNVWPGLPAVLALPGFALWLIDAWALTILLGALGARFRDIPPIVGSILQIAFFVTPVIWKPELIGPARQWILPFNPFFSLLELVRAPILGTMPSLAETGSALLYSALLFILTWVLFVRVRGRIAFWV
jgi:lipopolysaccharide transport system permease protein